MLRSCYAADMQFFHDSDETRRIVWYFVPDDRELLPHATVFASRIYDRKDENQLPIGEMYSPVPWRGGQAPGPVSTCGNCGSATDWLKGISIDDPPPETWPGTNVPKCCCPPPPQPIGGLGIGGMWVGPSPPNRPGGLAVGGFVRVEENALRVGGLAVGGLATAISATRSTGGLAIGGYVTWVMRGGEALGGSFLNTAPAQTTGGLALGGTFSTVYTPPNKVAVPFCSNLISIHLAMTINNTQCTCLPTLCNFTWDGVSKWQSTTTGTGCTGQSLITWYIRVNGGGTAFELVTSGENLTFFGTCGPPYTGLCLHSDGMGPSYCGGGMHGWSGALAEV
jgi:hypothetical protein